jgi:hypothetical protein
VLCFASCLDDPDPANALCAQWISLLQGPLVHQVIARIISTEYDGSNRAALKAVQDTMWETISRSRRFALMDTLVNALARAVSNHDRLLIPYREIILFRLAVHVLKRHGTHSLKAKPAVHLMAYSLEAIDCVGGTLIDQVVVKTGVSPDQWLRLLLDKAGPTPCMPLARLAYRHQQLIQSWGKHMWNLAIFQMCHLIVPQVLVQPSVMVYLPKVLTTPRTINLFQSFYDRSVMGVIRWELLETILEKVAESEPASFWDLVTSVSTVSDGVVDKYRHMINKAAVHAAISMAQ